MSCRVRRRRGLGVITGSIGVHRVNDGRSLLWPAAGCADLRCEGTNGTNSSMLDGCGVCLGGRPGPDSAPKPMQAARGE